MELPIYFAHSNYVINLSADHRVTFDPRDLRDDDDAEVGFLKIILLLKMEISRLLELEKMPTTTLQALFSALIPMKKIN